MLSKVGYAKRMFSTNVVIVSGKRTPIGSFMGQLSNISAPHLGVAATTAALREANVDAKDVEEVFYGQVLQAGCG